MKVAVVGSRDLEVLIEEYMPNGITAIISGGANGIDHLAEEYADKNDIPKIIFRPEYNKYGKNAPLVRNELIVDESDLVIAIWDGKSHGTKFTIDYALKTGKSLKLFIITKKESPLR